MADQAHSLDTDGDKFLSDCELRVGALGEDAGCGHAPSESFGMSSEDVEDHVLSLKSELSRLPNPHAAGYHSFAQMEKKISDMAEAHPDIMAKVSLGKTPEGRDIWALKVTNGAQGDTSHKTGVVVTGVHHAREWMTIEAPLRLLDDITSNLTDPAVAKRLEESELWVVPAVNPDGYEYSRTESAYWRKNRRPLGVDQNNRPTRAIGVDLNRNYWDGTPEHLFVYRPPGDTPGNTRDDYSATSDDPNDDTYRGPFGGSEPEVKAMLDLQLGRPNIKAVVDYHSYGDTILYPYGHTREPSPNVGIYKEIGQKMVDASSGFSLQQSVGLYPASGTSDDTHDLNGILNFTIEMGKSFQPNPRQIPAMTERVAQATYALIDEVIVRDDQGSLPPHSRA